MHFYNDSTNDTQSLSGNRSSAGDIKMSLNNSGNLGIGTTVPSALLNIRASAPTTTGTVPTGTNVLIDSNTSNYITFRNTADNGTYAGLIFLDNNVGGYITFGNSGAAVGSDSMIYGTFNDHIFQNGYINETLYNRTETMRIKQNGNVGIGSSSPAAKLDIVGTTTTIALSFGTTVPNNPLFINTYGGATGIGMDQTTAGIRLAGDYGGGSNPLVDIGYYSGATVSHANWISRFKILNNGNVNFTANVYHTIGGQKFFGGSGGTNSYIYTGTTSFSFINSSDSSTLVTILNGGNVGIGTTVPVARLHVASTTAAATLLRTDGTSGTLFSVVDDLSDSLMSVNNSAGLPVLEVFADDRIVGGQYGQNDFVIVNNKVGIGTNNPLAELHVTSSTSIPSAIFMGGNVGIGTSSPGVALHVERSSGDSTATFKATSGGAEINLDATNGYAALKLYSSGTEKWRVGQVGDSTGFQIFQGGIGNRVYINSSGNVGIGTTSPGSKLDVNGTFRTAINNLTIFNDYLYVSPTENNTFNSAYSTNGIADMWINYAGYNNGNTQFRNFNVGNGKNAVIAWFDGTNKRMSINNSQTANYTLDVNGSIYTSGKLVQNSTTQSITGTGQTLTLNVAAAAVHIVSMASGATITTISYSNRDNNPAVNTLMLVVKYAGTASITFTSVIWANDVVPTLTGTNGYADVFMLTSYKGGAGTPVWIGTVVAQALVSTNL